MFNGSGNGGTSQRERLDFLRRVIIIFFSSILLLGGIPGNILTIIVLRSRAMKDNFLSIFLVCLSVLNMLALTTGLSRHLVLALFEFNFQLLSLEVCAVHRWAIFMFLTSANWLLVAVTLGRMIFLQYADRASRFFTDFRVFVLVSSMLLFIGLYQYAALLRTLIAESRENSRQLVNCKLRVGTPFEDWDMALMCFIPVGLLIVMNTCYLRYLWYSIPTKILRRNSARLLGYHLGLLVLLSDIQFLVTNLPYGIVNSPAAWEYLTSQKERPLDSVGYDAALLLLYSNNASNFFIYCFFGKKFRLEMKKIAHHNMPKCCQTNFPKFVQKFQESEGSTMERSSIKIQEPSFGPEVIFSASGGNEDPSMANLFRDPDATPTFGTPEFSARASATTDYFLIGPRAGQIRNFSPDNLEDMLKKIDSKSAGERESYV